MTTLEGLARCRDYVTFERHCIRYDPDAEFVWGIYEPDANGEPATFLAEASTFEAALASVLEVVVDNNEADEPEPVKE